MLNKPDIYAVVATHNEKAVADIVEMLKRKTESSTIVFGQIYGMGEQITMPLGESHIGGFQLLDLIITELKSHMTCFKVSHWWKFYLSKKNPLQDLLSSLNSVISTNERHVTFKLPYNQIY